MKRILLPFLFIISCGPSPQKGIEVNLPPEKCIEEKFFSNEENDFGVYSVGMSRASFSDKTNTTHLIHTETEVIDSIPLCGNENSWCEATFLFYEGKLTDISATFFIGNEKSLAAVMEKMNEKLTRKYGTPAQEKGVYMRTGQRGNKPITIYLSDESVMYNRPVIRLSFVSEGKIQV